MKTVLVINALNGTLPLVLQKKYPSARITCAEVFPFYKHHLRNLGFEVVDWESMSGMKFDLVIGNPPYLKGAWREFLEKAIGLCNHKIQMIAPDGTNNFSPQSDRLVDLLKKAGIQSVVDCTDAFPNVNSGKIVVYNIDVTKPFNPLALQDTSMEGCLVNKVISYNSDTKLNAMLSKKRSAEHANVERHTKKKANTVRTLVSIGRENVEWFWIDKSHVTVIDAGQYWLTNRYFGRDDQSPVIEATGQIGIGTNILAVEKISGWTVQDFKSVYLDPLYQFVLKHLRQGGFDTSPRHIKQLPVLKLTGTKLYKKLGLDVAEVALVANRKH
jgi:hypothetical protein